MGLELEWPPKMVVKLSTRVVRKGGLNFQFNWFDKFSNPLLKVSKNRPANRLENASDFSFVFEDANAVHGRFFTLLFRKYNMENARLGLVVSKKNVGQAVKRNRLKRVIRESFRQAAEIIPKVDIIVLAKRCLLYTSPSPRDATLPRMPSSA